MSRPAVPLKGEQTPRTVVVSGGTDGMGRAVALGRAALGETVIVLGSNAEKGERLLHESTRLDLPGVIEFQRVDLSSLGETRAVIQRIAAHHDVVDALALFANRQAPRRTVTADGLEQVFAVYYLSRYLLSYGLSPLLRRSHSPVIVNVAGVGTTKGRLHWDDLQLEADYGMVAAQLQAARANDLLGVMFAAQPHNPVPYVLYHPGFTKSGDLAPLRPAVRVMLRALATLAARPVGRAVAPIHRFIEEPPQAPLSAIDRHKRVALSLKTLNPADADRLAAATRAILAAHEGTVQSG
ncbi:SDR family NAD(P)-dependent oxidoreductase [Mumia quercus]|uniref:SDR family NAD(P)-dependent oxidoreductase n=1 Tax=Mumia quercus TaxID=2976125 RepID=UPI0021CE2939|nr:SDR family NAD(P)-dependent oxidoreductase [Mumia quercus]